MILEREIDLGQASRVEATTPKPRGYWQDNSNIETEARQALEAGIVLSHPALKKARMSGLSTAIEKNYPGGINSLREQFGLPVRRRSDGYWGEDAQKIERRAREVMEAGRNLSDDSLKKAGMSGLSRAAAQHYPGGLTGLKEKMGIPVDTKPMGFWKDSANVESQAREAIESGIIFTTDSLRGARRSSLVRAISSYYPGGIGTLREKLGLPNGPKPQGYWHNPINIESAARQALAAGVDLKKDDLHKNDFVGLYDAIFKHYPGRLNGLREMLGIEDSRKPEGYWQDVDNIEKEVREALNDGISITKRGLKAGKSSLSQPLQLTTREALRH